MYYNVYIYIYIYKLLLIIHSVYIYIYMYMYIYLSLSINMYIHIYTHTSPFSDRPGDRLGHRAARAPMLRRCRRLKKNTKYPITCFYFSFIFLFLFFFKKGFILFLYSFFDNIMYFTFYLVH